MTKESLTQAYLKEALSYDPETGSFIWLKRPLYHFPNEHRMNLINSKCAGRRAGTVTGGGYLEIGLGCHHYRAHRLAFLYMTGAWPDQVDHINHDRLDNRFSNLRTVTVRGNNKNMGLRHTSITGVPGVQWHKKTKKWRVRIEQDHLGLFDDLQVRKRAETERGYHPNHGGG